MGADAVSPAQRPDEGRRPAGAANDNRPARVCPICRRPRAEKYDPFCSRRCADVDLYRWLSGDYAIPASEEAEPGEGSGEEE
jgi:uncharacterized protein